MAEDVDKIVRRIALDEVKRHRGDPEPHPRIFGAFGRQLAASKDLAEASELLGSSSSSSTDASTIVSGTLDDDRLSFNVTLQGNVFNGPNQLLKLGPLGDLPALDGSLISALNADNISSGTIDDARLSLNVPLLSGGALPAVSGANLTSLTAANLTGALPAISGANLTALNAFNISLGTLADARLSTNVPLLNATNNTFTGRQTFGSCLTQQARSGDSALWMYNSYFDTDYRSMNGAYPAFMQECLNGRFYWWQADAIAPGSIQTRQMRLQMDLLGNIGLGGITPTSGNGLLQLLNGYTKATGIAFGTSTFIYQYDTSSVGISGTSTPSLVIYENTGVNYLKLSSSATQSAIETLGSSPKSLLLKTNFTTAVTIDTSQNCAFAARVGFNGNAAIAKPALNAAAVDAATTQALVNQIRAALISYGLCT